MRVVVAVVACVTRQQSVNFVLGYMLQGRQALCVNAETLDSFFQAFEHQGFQYVVEHTAT